MAVTISGAAPADFLASVCALIDAGNVDDAAFAVADWVDRMLCDGAFSTVDAALDAVDAKRLDEDMLVAFLAATYPARHLLSRRAGFASVVQDRLRADIGEREADELVNDLS